MSKGGRAGVSVFVAALTVILSAVAVTDAGARGPSPAGPRHRPEVVVEDAARGLVYGGVRFSSPDGPCAGVRFEMRSNGHLVGCTHGPDAAPAGVDVRTPQALAELRSRTAPTPQGVRSTPCVGSGASQDRVQAIYAYVEGHTNRVNAVAPLIRTWAGQISAMYNASAAETAGSIQVPFVTNSQCQVTVPAVAIPSSAAGADFNATIKAIHDKGFHSVHRKYLVWLDVNVICGIGQLIPDTTPGASNQNNQTTANPFSVGMVARVDNGCWGLETTRGNPVEGHELTHTMGAVQSNAPHKTSNGHCTDEWDAMCYVDAGSTHLKFTCPSTHEALLDCGHDDYFHTAPPAGSYLKTHWNTANNDFLVRNLAPSNDRFAAAEVLDPGPGAYVGSTRLAGVETGEKATLGVRSHSIWYRVKVPTASTLTVDTQGTAFDTVLGVYTGQAVGSLTLKGANDDAKAGRTYSRVTIQTAANATYWIRVDGKGGKQGLVVLHTGFGGSSPVITSVSPLQGPPGTIITVKGTNLIVFSQSFTITIDGFFASITGSPTESQLKLKVPSSTIDPSTAQYTPGQSGPVEIDNGFGVGVSDQSFKFTQ